LRVRNSLEKQLGSFLRKKRGEQTFAEFSRRLGLPASTLHRLESGEQSVTLGKLEHIMKRLKCKLSDIFEI
jgi:DNA-binding Xre family transcriptional regulator